MISVYLLLDLITGRPKLNGYTKTGRVLRGEAHALECSCQHQDKTIDMSHNCRLKR